MNILHLHPGPDTGGTSVGAKRILEATGDEVRVFVKALHAFDYPHATLWDDAAIDESFDWADVVVIHNDPSLFTRVARGRSKPLVVHHHGSRFRRYPIDLYRDAHELGAVQVVSTVDLLLSVPRHGVAYWMPQSIDLAHMAAVRAGYQPGPVVRVSHAPTNRQIKGTGLMLRAARNLGGLVELVLINHKRWERCLAMKAGSDIYYDQPYLGYGNNALESWGMGLPVIAGARADIIERMKREYGGRLPFWEMTFPATLEEDLRALAGSADLRAEWAARGMAHIARFHSDAAIAERAHDIYDRAMRPIASSAA